MNLVLTFLVVLLRFVEFLSSPIFNYFHEKQFGKKRITVPPITNEILNLSAAKLAEKIRQKQLSCEEIVRCYIDRIKEINPTINAVVQDRFRDSLKEAKNVDKFLNKTSLSAEELKIIKPLLGVPVTIKESCSLKGLSFAVGSKSRSGFKAELDGELVARLKTNGAIPLLVSNTPELCLAFETNNLITGLTKNPYDISLTSGGSSGGEAALLGAAASVIGIGSDVAGSIRLPAVFNGVFGHKPSPRMLSIKGHYPTCYDPKFADLFVIGPMTRYAEDLRLTMRVLAGKKSNDLGLNDTINLKDIKVFYLEEIRGGFWTNLLFPPVEDELKKLIKESAMHLRGKFMCNIEPYNFEEVIQILGVCGEALYGIKDIPNLLKSSNSNVILELAQKVFLGKSEYSWELLNFYFIQSVFVNSVPSYKNKFVRFKQDLLEKLGDNGVLLCPVYPTTPTKHHKYFYNMHCLCYVMLANVMGLPATSVPCGNNKNSLPIGLQVIAGPQQDGLCITIAEKLQDIYGGWTVPSPTLTIQTPTKAA